MVAGFDVLDQIFVCDGNLLLVPLDLTGGEGKALVFFQFHRTLGKGTDTDFRPFGVQHGRDGQMQLPAKAFDCFQPFSLLLMGTMGKIETGYVHARFHQFSQDVFVICRRTKGTYNLGFSPVGKKIAHKYDPTPLIDKDECTAAA